ncbi:helix-turn-helix domain-containing protein [Streptomyces zaomyceticus]|uniref:helix-turn-helix domain-containing protein n=1 Tax=Streptomyces zaomyceticus TaxID=68286 RepID=UPI0016734E2F|nr:helix-turn-helix transcriptional regulator [Streptomyces zaomyceticus]GHG42525.1 transcriptional regulator [Streptomyces zaomyceticus]
MVNIRSLDPSASPLDYYGAELRRLREEANLSQAELGSILYCTASLIGQIETAKKVPTRQFSERLDAALLTGGVFSRLVGLVLKSQLPTWFQAYAEMEAKATYISTYQSQLVYGLLQAEPYARAVLSVENPGRLDEMVAARVERQRILEREHPPVLCVVLDEAVLYREIGGAEVMRNQLAHLLRFRDHPWVQVQVLPFSVGQHPGLLGSFNVLRFEDDPDIVYSESYESGRMSANSQVIREVSVSYARLQASALSREASAALIERVMKERYGHQPGPPVA